MGGGRFKNVMTVEDILKLNPKRKIPASVLKAASKIISINMQQSDMPNKTVLLSSGSSQPLALTPITVAHRESDVSKERTLRARTKGTKEIMSVISGSSPEAMTKQTSHIVESFDADSREATVANLDQVIKISAEQMSSIKSCLSLPWNLVREIRRLLGSFKIDVPSESSMRSVVGDWVGPSLRAEEIPATVVKNKTKLIALKPWCYI